MLDGINIDIHDANTSENIKDKNQNATHGSRIIAFSPSNGDFA